MAARREKVDIIHAQVHLKLILCNCSAAQLNNTHSKVLLYSDGSSLLVTPLKKQLESTCEFTLIQPSEKEWQIRECYRFGGVLSRSLCNSFTGESNFKLADM